MSNAVQRCAARGCPRGCCGACTRGPGRGSSLSLGLRLAPLPDPPARLEQGVVSGERQVEIASWFGPLESTFYTAGGGRGELGGAELLNMM